MRAAPVLTDDALLIRPWPDPVLDALGLDPRSPYVEQFWLGVLGPSTTWLLRRIADGFDASPEGFELSLLETARELGVGYVGGRHSPFLRALTRLCQFDLGAPQGEGVMAVRRKVPPLNRRQIVKLPDRLREAHDHWQATELRAQHDQLRERARQLALSLFELGEDAMTTERQLQRWRFHPALCREATVWAFAEHERAAAAMTDVVEAEA